ncbi:MAG: hypothetical protein JO040_12665 [Gemmatimonadetes bacterium]|nr:hypothetical protein [Gemmatimonadota bacterium]
MTPPREPRAELREGVRAFRGAARALGALPGGVSRVLAAGDALRRLLPDLPVVDASPFGVLPETPTVAGREDGAHAGGGSAARGWPAPGPLPRGGRAAPERPGTPLPAWDAPPPRPRAPEADARSAPPAPEGRSGDRAAEAPATPAPERSAAEGVVFPLRRPRGAPTPPAPNRNASPGAPEPATPRTDADPVVFPLRRSGTRAGTGPTAGSGPDPDPVMRRDEHPAPGVADARGPAAEAAPRSAGRHGDTAGTTEAGAAPLLERLADGALAAGAPPHPPEDEHAAAPRGERPVAAARGPAGTTPRRDEGTPDPAPGSGTAGRAGPREPAEARSPGAPGLRLLDALAGEALARHDPPAPAEGSRAETPEAADLSGRSGSPGAPLPPAPHAVGRSGQVPGPADWAGQGHTTSGLRPTERERIPALPLFPLPAGGHGVPDVLPPLAPGHAAPAAPAPGVPAAPPPIGGWPGGAVEAAPAAELDADALASLVNDALVEQARRHGVDLS